MPFVFTKQGVSMLSSVLFKPIPWILYIPTYQSGKEVITFCDNLPETIKFSPVTSFAFTEQGVAMLSSVLKSKKALQVNVAIMRVFVYIRQYALTHKDLTDKIKELEKQYNKQFADVYDAINYLLQKDKQQTDQKNRKRIGFDTDKQE